MQIRGTPFDEVTDSFLNHFLEKIMNNKLLSVRAYLIEANYYLTERNPERAHEYLKNALDILDGKRVGDFEESFLENLRNY